MAAVHALLPFRDRSRGRRLVKVGAWFAAIALVAALLQLLGVDVGGWFSDVWDALTGVGVGYLVAGWTLQTAQTTLTALGWYFILRAGFPDAPMRYRQILAAYAAGVALNGFLPANIGTVVMLLMYVAIIPGANLPGVLGGMVVQKIFFTVVGAFVYVYLFATVSGTFERQLKLPHDHPVLLGAAVLVARLPARDSRAHLLAQAQGAVGEGQAGRRDPRAPARVPREASYCRRSARGSRSSA